MMSKTTNKFSPEVRERAVRLVLDNEGQHASRWQAVTSIAAKIGCTPQTLNDWVKKAEVDSGLRAGIPTEMAEKMKALERENRDPGRTAPTDSASAPIQRREGTKQDMLITMLRAPEGATIAEIVAATGWQAHSARGAMSGVLKKKLGLTITSEKVTDRGRTYRIED